MNEYQVTTAKGSVLFRDLLWDGVSDTMTFKSGFGFVSVRDCKSNGWQIKNPDTCDCEECNGH